MLCSAGRRSAKMLWISTVLQSESEMKLTSWLTMSPVKMVKLISSTLKNEGIDLKEDNARSGGESQYK